MQAVTKSGYKMTEAGLIPEDWEVKKLKDLADIATGNTPPTNDKSNYGDDFLFVSPFDLGLKKYISNSEKKLSKKGFQYSRRFPPFSILYTCIGSTIGKSGVSTFELTSNQQINAIFPNENYSTEYLYYLLDLFSHKIRSQAGEQAVPIVSKSLFGETVIPLPPLPEQTAIANALKDTDDLINSLENLIAKKKLVKQGAMQELLKPKDGWIKKKLGEVATILRGGSPRPIEYYLTNAPDGINWVKIGDVHKEAKYIISTEEKITKEGAQFSRFVNEGDFLLSNSMSFGRPYIMKTNGCIHDGWLVIKEYNSTFDKDFLYYSLGASAIMTQYKSMAAGSGVLNLSKDVVKEVFIEYPSSIVEQMKISSYLSDIDNEIDLLDSKLKKCKTVKQGMMQQLLTGKIRLL